METVLLSNGSWRKAGGSEEVHRLCKLQNYFTYFLEAVGGTLIDNYFLYKLLFILAQGEPVYAHEEILPLLDPEWKVSVSTYVHSWVIMIRNQEVPGDKVMQSMLLSW